MLSKLRTAGFFLRHPRTAAVAGLTVGILIALPAAASALPKDAFVGEFGQQMMLPFTLGSGDTLSPNGSGVASGEGPRLQAVTPNGKNLYVVNSDTDTVSQYAITSSGTLTALSPATVTVGSEPWSVAVSPDGRNAYVANSDSGTVTVLNIASDGRLTVASTVTGFDEAYSVAVSPNGSSVYVADTEAGKIYEYNRASDGALTAKATPSIPATDRGSQGELIMTPNGKFLYEADSDGNIYQFSVGSGGQLAALTVPVVGSDPEVYSLVVSPNGHNLYATSCSGDDGIDQYSIASDGELTTLTPASVPDGCGMSWMTPDGSSFYAPSDGQYLYQYNVASSGALTPKTPAFYQAPTEADIWAITIPPDQGPLAEFSAKAGKAGHATKFDAKKSSAPDGKVVSYHWSFGDGHSLTTTKATASHTYKKAGKYKVTLTVTDNSGCADALVFTGQTAYCTPGKPAKHSVKIASAVKRLHLKVSPGSATAGKTICYALTVTSKGHPINQSTVTLGGHSTTSNSGGKAKLCLSLTKGNHTARATKHGYVSATATVHITPAAPVFTG